MNALSFIELTHFLRRTGIRFGGIGCEADMIERAFVRMAPTK